MGKRRTRAKRRLKVVLRIVNGLRAGFANEARSRDLYLIANNVRLLRSKRAVNNDLSHSNLYRHRRVVIFSRGVKGRFFLCKRKVLVTRFLSYLSSFHEGTGLFGYFRGTGGFGSVPGITVQHGERGPPSKCVEGTQGPPCREAFNQRGCGGALACSLSDAFFCAVFAFKRYYIKAV